MIDKAECGLAIVTLTTALNERDAEIDRLRKALADAMTEIAQLRGEYGDAP